MGRGRPPLERDVIRVQIKLSLHVGRDDDLIEFFESLPSGTRATAVMAAMRSGNIGAGEIYADGPAESEMDDALMDSFVL